MQDETEILRGATAKAIRRIVPFTTLMFVLSFLDRVNVGFAKQELQRDTGIGDAAFALGLGRPAKDGPGVRCKQTFSEQRRLD